MKRREAEPIKSRLYIGTHTIRTYLYRYTYTVCSLIYSLRGRCISIYTRAAAQQAVARASSQQTSSRGSGSKVSHIAGNGVTQRVVPGGDPQIPPGQRGLGPQPGPRAPL